MPHLNLKAELRDRETIRAYFDELVLLKTPIQLWLPQSDAPPLETTIERISGDTFITATTRPLPAGQQLFISFLLEARRFNAPTQVVSTGVFRIPTSIAQGERRERLRAEFLRSDGIRFFAIERLAGTIATGRCLLGTLLDLSLQGLRIAVDELDFLTGDPAALKRGDVFEAVLIQGLPFTPDIHCRAILAHLNHTPEGDTAGFALEGITATDQQEIGRILARRFPTTFGQAFPKKKRKTDLGDRQGTPLQAPAPVKAPEVIAAPPPDPTPRVRPARPPVSVAMRLRKVGLKILIISGSSDGAAALAEDLRADDFRHVQVANSFLEARHLASATRFDLLLLDLKVGGHFGQMILEALREHELLLNTQVILVADPRDASLETVAEEIGAIHIHDKRETYEELVPVLHKLLSR